MNRCAVLLTSDDAGLIESIGHVAASIPGCDFATASQMNQVGEHLVNSGPTLLICHATLANLNRLLRLLGDWGSPPKPIATLVVCEGLESGAAEALRQRGAADCLGLPLDVGHLEFLIDSFTLIARYGPVRRDPRPGIGAADQEQPEFCFRSPEMINLLQRVRKVASQDLSILISGETGVGKTRLARLIHDLSPRRDNIFLTVNCAALSENLLESEFFGHCKGAFTGAGAERIGKFAAAGSGTLLLDEIDALPLSAQPKLLRAIDERLFEPVGSNQTQKLHARLIVATNRNLTNEVAAGRFRTDLYYRLKVIEFELPPLRRRRQIIPVIAEAQLRECAARNQRTPPRLTPAALQALTLYDWPGNIRELRNVIECALAFADEEIQLENLPEAVRNGAAPAHSPALTVLSKMESAAQPERPPTRDELPAEVHDDSGDFAFGPQLSSLAQARALGEIGRIRRVLETSGNNRSLAARVLGISRAALYKRLRKFGLLDPDPLNGIDDTNP